MTTKSTLPVLSPQRSKIFCHFWMLLFLIPPAVSQFSADGTKQTFGGVVSANLTLRYANGPYRVDRDILVEEGATLTIQTGTEMYFDPGIGIKVHGTLYAVGVPQARIKFLPFNQPEPHTDIWTAYPKLRLIDGPTSSRGRLQTFFRDRWRGVCTQNTNWTETDLGTACRGLGFGGGGFWRWYRRNNDTRPFVMPKPGCQGGEAGLWECPGLLNHNRIPLSENLCQGEDDLGLICWGPPAFPGWEGHWKGLQFISAPYTNVPADPNLVGTMKQSLSRLEYVDILYAGVDGSTHNATGAIRVEGIPPFINDIRVEYSGLDGLSISETDGPVLIANSTISHNRGRGIVITDTTDGRVFINETRIERNFGDGVWYRQRPDTRLEPDFVPRPTPDRFKRQSFYQDATPLINFCERHNLDRDWAFPYLIEGFLPNGTLVSEQDKGFPCYVPIELPRRFPYEYNFQFMDVNNKNPDIANSSTELVICRRSPLGIPACDGPELYSIPIRDRLIPQTVSTRNEGSAVLVALRHSGTAEGRVIGDVRVKLRIHATVTDHVYYGLNISNSVVDRNGGRGVWAGAVRDRLVITNASLSWNEDAGLLVRHGAANLWINDTKIDNNRGDGMNVTYAGGSVIVNGTSLSKNGLRGAAFHHNSTLPYLPLEQGIRFLGRSGSERFVLPTVVKDNAWGGILVGNFCASAVYRIPRPSVALDYVELMGNQYHPAFEVHSCQREGEPETAVSVTGCIFERSSGFGMRIAPAVNVDLTLSQNWFFNNSRALLIRNREHPQLRDLPARVTVYKNQFKFNKGPYIVNIGLNEDAPLQSGVFHQQNELRENIVLNPYPYLNPRSTPYAALIVSSSNIRVVGNCFQNQRAKYEMATDLAEHAKWIQAERNNWGAPEIKDFAYKIFDQFYRYNLAQINFLPYASTCNAQNPNIVEGQTSFVRQFRRDQRSGELGGMIYGNADLPAAVYTVSQDLHILPGARVSVAPGAELQFENGIGMLVQGELQRLEFRSFGRQRVTFTRQQRNIPIADGIRLVQSGVSETLEGRLEVKLDKQWGTVCNRSWTVDLAAKACHQLGLIIDPEFYENWRTYPPPGNLPMLMDNIWCEEAEWDIRRCRHDGPKENIASSCPSDAVVGLRCVEAAWAGVRYSLLANPPLVTGQRNMQDWTIERAGLFDFALSEFCAALQLDWNYHAFEGLEIKDNFWTGLDIVYNDLTRKPTLFNSAILRNRRHGIRLRSVGLTVQQSEISDNEVAGIRYNPIVSARLQKDVVTWLIKRDMSIMEANHVYVIPSRTLNQMELGSSAEASRRFLVAQPTEDCPMAPRARCVYLLRVATSRRQGHIAVQVVNRPSNSSDENLVITAGRQSWNLQDDLIRFPLLVNESEVTLRYTRSKGPPSIVLLLLYMGRQEYVDRFVHVYLSEVRGNAYGVSTLHYSNFSHWDGASINRWEREKLWFQKTNFTANKQAVVWVNGPLRDVGSESAFAEIEYKIDNCSITLNKGSVIETHRDLYSSANIFHWDIWSCTFRGNEDSGVSIALPDPADLRAPRTHSLRLTESRFYNNKGLELAVRGYHAFLNISSNNFTENAARPGKGLLHIRGMEKELIMERNRWLLNQGNWVIKYDIQSQTIKKEIVPAVIRYNYLDQNWFISDPNAQTLINYPRSYAIGLFGIQPVTVNYNRLNNFLMDYECVVGLRPSHYLQTNDLKLNWWGESGGTPQGLIERVFDFDDWNSYMLGAYSPYFVTEEKFIDWWWKPSLGQQADVQFLEPSIYSLRGRMFVSKTLSRTEERWPSFPFHLKPQRPYRLTHDLTIMPGATLTIESGVSVHLMPNVRILVLGSLRAEGSFYDPIRIRPLNGTELAGLSQTDFVESGRKRRKRDIVYRRFPLLARQDGFYQKFKTFLIGGNNASTGWLEIYNATTGEMVPICDRQFTNRNAQVVCREQGQPWENAYSWVGPRYAYDPRIRLVRSYSEPRQCFGTERALSECDLRLNGDRDLWYCSDTLHFVFIYCSPHSTLRPEFVGHHGGLMFSAPSLEEAAGAEESILRHVEIVGGGRAHNRTLGAAGALGLVYRSPVLEYVNVTNSSRDGVLILAPRTAVELRTLNVSHNSGIGLNLLALNLQSSVGGTGERTSVPHRSQGRNLTLPYDVFGMLNLCSVGKNITVRNRLLLYFKYDSYPVDCVKIFTSEQPARRIGFRLLQVNLYDSHDPAGRPDTLRFYSSRQFTINSIIGEYNASAPEEKLGFRSPAGLLAVHLRANAADGDYGLIAEVTSLPASPDQAPAQLVSVSDSRFLDNERGGGSLASLGETAPSLLIRRCQFADNGRHVWGNFTTATAALGLRLHNTRQLRLTGSLFRRNTGGLRLEADSSTVGSRLQGLIKNCAFTENSVWETLLLRGVEYQAVSVLGCLFAKNRARYRDILLVDRFIANITLNTFYNNTGTHIVDMTGYPGLQTEYEVFTYNMLYDNIALGHGYQFSQHYGYLPFRNRRKRQIDVNSGTSFDWWAHVGAETERYRSTVLAGSSRQQYRHNLFVNPFNDFELTTANLSDLDGAGDAVSAPDNFWGYPGTDGAAAGKIRDQADYPYLVPVRYSPVLAANTSLLDGSCPPGWLQAGDREFRSCYLLVPGAADFASAVAACKAQDAILPYFSPADPRLADIAEKVQARLASLLTPLEASPPAALAAFPPPASLRLWYSGVAVTSGRCAVLDTASRDILDANCGELNPFVCGLGSRQRPFLWTATGWAVAGAVVALLALLACLLAGWAWKSRQRKKEHFERKASMRESVRSNKLAKEYARQRADQQRAKSTDAPVTLAGGASLQRQHRDPLAAHRAMLSGDPSPTKSLYSTTTTLSSTRNSPVKRPVYTPSKDHSDYGSASHYSSVPNFETAASTSYGDSLSRSYGPQRESVETGTSLSSFRPAGDVAFRPGGRGRRHDTTTTDATGTTVTCSTCPTESSSYDAEASRDSRFSRATATGTEYSDDGSFSSTETEGTVTGASTLPSSRSPDPRHRLAGNSYQAQLSGFRDPGGGRLTGGQLPAGSPRHGLPPPPAPPPSRPSGASFPNLAFESGATLPATSGNLRSYANWAPPPPLPPARRTRHTSSSDSPLETAM